MSKFLSKEFVISSLENYGYYLLDINEYRYSHEPISMFDKEGYLYKTSFSALMWNLKLENSQRRFSTKNPYTLQNINNWIKLNNKSFEFVKGIWTGSGDKTLFFKCKNCGEIWDMRWNNIISGNNCPYCSGKRSGKTNNLKILYPEISKEWNYEKNQSNPEEFTYGSSKKAWWICEKGHEWFTEISNRTSKNNTNCPKCSESKGEKSIQKFLEENNILYTSQKKFQGCKDKRELPFDYYIAELNMCIEYQGMQHFRNVSFTSDKEKSKREYVSLKKRDNIKKKFCRNNGIYLLEISYLDFNNIEKILTKVFNL